ncbi:MAG TPA: methyltransferase domain-containing protein [Gemmataceae bacterium]
MSAHTARVIAYFDQCLDDYRRFWGLDRHLSMHAGFYDARHRSHAAAMDNANRVLADLAGVRPGERVLDAGCGVGGSAMWLARHAGAEVVGVNIHPAQVEIARKHAARRRLGHRASFRLADYLDTGLPGESFDVVWALESVAHAPDKRDFLREAWRLLKPGGRLIVSDVFLTRPCRTRAEERAVRGWCDGWAVPDLVRAERFAAWAAEAGFGGVRFLDATPLVRPASRRMLLLAVALYPWARALQGLGLRTRVQTGNVAAAYYQYRIGRSGLGVYGILLARRPGADRRCPPRGRGDGVRGNEGDRPGSAGDRRTGPDDRGEGRHQRADRRPRCAGP